MEIYSKACTVLTVLNHVGLHATAIIGENCQQSNALSGARSNQLLEVNILVSILLINRHRLGMFTRVVVIKYLRSVCD